MDRERDDGHEAKGEPRIAFDDMSGVVAAVVALTDNTLVAFYLFPEGMLAAGEY